MRVKGQVCLLLSDTGITVYPSSRPLSAPSHTQAGIFSSVYYLRKERENVIVMLSFYECSIFQSNVEHLTEKMKTSIQRGLVLRYDLDILRTALIHWIHSCSSICVEAVKRDCMCVLQEWEQQWELHHWLHLPAVQWRGQRSLWLQEERPGTHAAGTNTHISKHTNAIVNMIRMLFICRVVMFCRVVLLPRLTGTLAPRSRLKPCSGSPRSSKSFTEKVKSEILWSQNWAIENVHI